MAKLSKTMEETLAVLKDSIDVEIFEGHDMIVGARKPIQIRSVKALERAGIIRLDLVERSAYRNFWSYGSCRRVVVL